MSPDSAGPTAAPAARAREGGAVYAALALLVLVAGALRVHLALRSPLWFEEIYFVLLSRRPAHEVWTTASRDIHPPLAFLVRHAWIRLGGDGAAWNKGFSIALTLACLPLAFRLFRRWFGTRAALLAVAFSAVAFALVRYGQEVGMYPVQWLLALVVVDAWTAWLENDRAGAAIAGVAASLLALYTHYAFLAVQALLLAWGLVALRGDARRRRSLLLLHLAILAGFLPQLPVFLEQLAREGTLSLAKFPRPHEIADYIRKLCLSHTPLLPAFAILALVPLFDRARRRAAAIAWTLVLLPPLAIRVLPVSFPNEFLFAAPIWFALVAAGVDGRPLRGLRLALAAVLVALAARWSWQAPPFPEGVALRASLARLAAMRAPGDLVVHAESHSILTALYYDPAGRHRLLLGDGGTEYFDGGLEIPVSARITTAAFAREVDGGAAWWGVGVDRARVARDQVTRAGAAQARAIAAAAHGRRWIIPPVTLWEGRASEPH